MNDPFSAHNTFPTHPTTQSLEHTPSDADDVPTVPRAVSVNTAGLVRYTAFEDTPGTSVSMRMEAGVLYPIRVSRIWATGTAAAGFVLHW